MADRPHYYGRLDNEFLDSLELSVRADRVLRAWGRVQSLDDFLNLKRSDVMALKGAGARTWREVSDMQRAFRDTWTEQRPPQQVEQAPMSLRDAAALGALQGTLANPEAMEYLTRQDIAGSGPHFDRLARSCWAVADAFIAARETKTDG